MIWCHSSKGSITRDGCGRPEQKVLRPGRVLWADAAGVSVGDGRGVRGCGAGGDAGRELLRPTGVRGGWADEVDQSAGAEEAAAPGEGEECHLPLHVRRAEPYRYVRLQTGNEGDGW